MEAILKELGGTLNTEGLNSVSQIRHNFWSPAKQEDPVVIKGLRKITTEFYRAFPAHVRRDVVGRAVSPSSSEMVFPANVMSCPEENVSLARRTAYFGLRMGVTFFSWLGTAFAVMAAESTGPLVEATITTKALLEAVFGGLGVAVVSYAVPSIAEHFIRKGANAKRLNAEARRAMPEGLEAAITELVDYLDKKESKTSVEQTLFGSLKLIQGKIGELAARLERPDDVRLNIQQAAGVRPGERTRLLA